MPIDCQRSTSSGKGNKGKFKETSPKLAAGIPTAQPDVKVSDSLQHYLLQEEAGALIGDAIIPPKPPRPLAPLRHPIPKDMRHARLHCEVSYLINPPNKTKWQGLAADLKNTVYSSYWNKPLGQVRDPTPKLPDGFDIEGTTFGKKTPYHGRLYDIVMPKVPYPDNTRPAKRLAVQKDLNYCSPAFRSDVTYGYRTNANKSGACGKRCVTRENVVIGTRGRVQLNSVQADYQVTNASRLGRSLTPNNNIKEVPPGHAFGKTITPGNMTQTLSNCKINPEKQQLKKCFIHLNKVRKVLSTRFLPTYFGNLYLGLKYLDKERTGWLPRMVVYDYCNTKFIRFDASLIEPLLKLWNAFNGEQVEYKTFVRVINYTIPSPELPTIPDFTDSCIDYNTTYTEMVNPNQPTDCNLRAGVPSGVYFDVDYPTTPDGCLRAMTHFLPDETDMKACLNPSVMTLSNVTHRDMYAKREPETVRRVFENTGEEFTDETFMEIWEEAKKLHSEGWVCFETFRRALNVIRPMSY